MYPALIGSVRRYNCNSNNAGPFRICYHICESQVYVDIYYPRFYRRRNVTLPRIIIAVPLGNYPEYDTYHFKREIREELWPQHVANGQLAVRSHIFPYKPVPISSFRNCSNLRGSRQKIDSWIMPSPRMTCRFYLHSDEKTFRLFQQGCLRKISIGVFTYENIFLLQNCNGLLYFDSFSFYLFVSPYLFFSKLASTDPKV